MTNQENDLPEVSAQDFMTNKTYNIVKFWALVVLPAISTLYLTIGNIWGFPAVEAVVGTIVAIDTFLGVLLNISSKTYNASTVYSGAIVINQGDNGQKVYSLELAGPPQDLEYQDSVTFKVIS